METFFFYLKNYKAQNPYQNKERRHNISEKTFRYPKYIRNVLRISQRTFRISKFAMLYVCMSEIRNVSDFSSLCFGYRIGYPKISPRICYDASPYIQNMSQGLLYSFDCYEPMHYNVVSKVQFPFFRIILLSFLNLSCLPLQEQKSASCCDYHTSHL